MSSSSGLFRVPHALEGAIPSGAASPNYIGGAISPIADVEMGEPSHTPHETMMVSGPPSPRTKVRDQTYMDWSARSIKRPLDGAGTPKDKKAASSSSEPSTFQPSADRQMADAAYYVQKMGHENAELGQQLVHQSIVAQRAAHDYLLKSNLSEQQREAEQQKNRQIADGLARAYDEQTRANSLQVISDREKGLQANLMLQNELHQASLRYDRMETEAKSEIQKRDGATHYWRAELEQESQIAVRNSEQSRDAERRCSVAENTLRQKPVINVPKDQAELHQRLVNVEQQAMQHASSADQRSELVLEHSSRQIRSLTDDVRAKQLSPEIAARRGGEAEDEITRLGIQLAQERSSSFSTRQGLSESKDSNRISDQKHLEVLANFNTCRMPTVRQSNPSRTNAECTAKKLIKAMRNNDSTS